MAETLRPLRVATWNLERRGTPDRVELIEALAVDVLLAQEVTEGAHEALVASNYFDWSAFSLLHRPRSVRESRSERLGVAIFGRHPIRLRASGILPWLMRPEKLVHTDLAVPGWRESVSVASYHASPGDGKPECTLQVAHWLELQFGSTILGLDANSPDVDHPDFDQSVFHWQDPPFGHCETALIGPPSARRHRLEDAFRLWLAARPEELAVIRSEHPTGPLACTSDRGSTSSRVKASRFDSIWVSPEFHVSGIAPVGRRHRSSAGWERPRDGRVVLVRPPGTARRTGQRVLDHVVENYLLDTGTELQFAVDLIADPVGRSAVEAWIEADPARAAARFTGDRSRPLEWVGGAGVFTLVGLAEQICTDAGAECPSNPPGPHWWRDASGRSHVAISEEAG